MRLLRDRNRTGAYVSFGGVGIFVFGMFFFLTVFMQAVWGYSALKTGVAYLPFTAALLLASGAAAQLLPRIGARPLLVAGSAASTGGLYWPSRIGEHDTYTSGVLGPTMVIGAGTALLFVTLSLAVQATFEVVAPVPDQLFKTDQVSGTASFVWHGTYPATSVTQTAITSPPVQAPYRTFSSATDAQAHFAEAGQQFGISGAGAGLSSSSDAYSAIYLPGAVGTSSTIDTEVSTQQSLTGSGAAGILVRDDMTESGTGPQGVALYESPTGGIQLQWTSNGGTNLDSVTPANGTNPMTLPVHLKLQRISNTTYTGYYSFNGAAWMTVGTATVPGQADRQDAGMFVTSHASGSPATVSFDGLTVTDGATVPPPATSYEAEAPSNTIGGQARISSCSTCSGGKKIGFIGKTGTLTFNDVNATADGDYAVTIAYLNGPPSRQAMVSVDGGTPQTLTFAVTTDFNTLGVMNLTLHLTAGANTIEFANPSANAPDIDRILVGQVPSP